MGSEPVTAVEKYKIYVPWNSIKMLLYSAFFIFQDRLILSLYIIVISPPRLDRRAVKGYLSHS